MKKKRLKLWDKLFYYDHETGKLLNRIERNSRAKIGDECGSNSNGYRSTRVDGKRYRVHRIIWEMLNGEIPEGLEIDHINRVRDDNRIINLRLATRQEQNLNLSQRVSMSGVTGVVFNKKDRKWQAQIGFLGKHIYLGQFSTKSEAICVRKEAETKYGFRS